MSERGFLINILLLESHGYTMEGTIVESLREVQDETLCEGGRNDLKISRKLITEVKNVHVKYKADLVQKEKMEEEQNKCKK